MNVVVRQTVRMDIAYRLERLRADGDRLIEAATTDHSAEVPGCPDWTTADLLAHMGTVWRMLAMYVDRLPSAPITDADIPKAPEGDALDEFARTGLADLLVVLAAADPDAAMWTFGEDQSVAFFIRRAHLETLLHRVDAERAIGSLTPVIITDAGDAVDELISIAYRGAELPSGSLHLHQTDGDGEWMLEVIDGAVLIRREHAKGDAALRGSGEELMLAMWGRRSVDGLELFGDRSIVEEWISLAP